MFDRKKYKKFAKMQLKSRWATPVMMTLFTALILTLMNLPGIRRDIQDIRENQALYEFSEENGIGITGEMFFSAPSSRGFLDEIVSWLAVFAEFVLIFAMIGVYVKMSHGPEPVKFGTFIEGFSLWSKGILCGLWKSLWTLLWSLLFLFPGIVKSYAYSQTEYLLLEYPELSVTKAMRISILITRGHKGDLFVQDISFLGWAFLASVPFGLGWLWLFPYISMTKVNSFHALLKEAAQAGLISQEDLKN